MKMKPTPRPPTPRRVPKRMSPRRILPARAASSNEEVDDYDGEHEPSMKLSHAFIVVLLLHVLAVGGVFAFNTLKSNGREKTTPAETVSAPKPEAAASAETAPKTVETPASTPAAPVAKAGPTHTVVAGDTLTRIASQHKTTVEALEKANGLITGATIRVGQVLSLPTAPAAAPAVVTKQVPAPVVEKPAATVPAPKVAETKPTPAATAAPVTPAAAKSGETYVVAKGDNPYSIAKKLKVSYTELLKVNKIDDPKKLQIGQKLIVP